MVSGGRRAVLGNRWADSAYREFPGCEPTVPLPGTRPSRLQQAFEPRAYKLVGAEEGLPSGILGNMQMSSCHVIWRRPHHRPDIWAPLWQTGLVQAVTPPGSPSSKTLSLLDFYAPLLQTAPKVSTTFSLLSFPSAYNKLARKAQGGAGRKPVFWSPPWQALTPPPASVSLQGTAFGEHLRPSLPRPSSEVPWVPSTVPHDRSCVTPQSPASSLGEPPESGSWPPSS